MSMTDQLESDWLKHYFTNAPIPNVGDPTGLLGAGTVGSLYISLHTSDPGETGSQNTNESAYTNYVRVAVPRNVTNWAVSGTSPAQVANALAITFAQCGATGSTVTHFGIGFASSGAGTLHFSGALTSSLAISNGVTPSFAISAVVVTQD